MCLSAVAWLDGSLGRLPRDGWHAAGQPHGLRVGELSFIMTQCVIAEQQPSGSSLQGGAETGVEFSGKSECVEIFP